MGHAHVALWHRVCLLKQRVIAQFAIEFNGQLGLNLIYSVLLTSEFVKLFLVSRWLLFGSTLKSARVLNRRRPHFIAVDAIFEALAGEVLVHSAHLLSHLDFGHRLVVRHVLEIQQRISRPF